ncbi:MAG: hypothetical protein ACI9Z3_000736 [Roseivirga sp.]|jgi:hypothetical protein
MESTEFIIINDWKEEVTVYLTLEVSEGFVADVSQIPFIKKGLNMYQGAFQLSPQKFVLYKSPKGMVFGGKISFNSLPLNRPIPSFPAGINIAEFTINNHLDLPKTYEKISINNTAGTNSYMKFTVNGGGQWAQQNSSSGMDNSKNTLRTESISDIGTFSLSYDNETINSSSISQSLNITAKRQKECSAKRPATSAGGILALTYLGPTNANAEMN